MAANFQIFSNAFSSVKMLKFQLGFHRNLFLSFQLTVSQHWCRWWLGADQATNHYLNQWWSCLLMHICIIRPQWVKNFKVSIVKWWIGTYLVPSYFLKQQWPSLKHTGAFLGGNGLNLYRGSIVMILRNYSLYWLYWSQLIGCWIKKYVILTCLCVANLSVNWSRLVAAYVYVSKRGHYWFRYWLSAFFSTRALSEPMLPTLHGQKQTSITFWLKYHNFLSRKSIS